MHTSPFCKCPRCRPSIRGADSHSLRLPVLTFSLVDIGAAPLDDVFEQTRAAEAVAPPGFRIHYDFNSTRSLAAVLPIVRELEANHPIVAFIEDALHWDDIEGWRQLRAQTTIPLVRASCTFEACATNVHL